MKNCSLTLLYIVTGFFAAAQDPGWAYSIGGTNGGLYGETGFAITTDKTGNIYTTGHFESLADFDPGPGVFEMDASAGISNFITKTDSAGNFIWATTFGGCSASSIAVDSACNVYVAGSFGGTVDFDPGAGFFELTATTIFGNSYLAKLDSAGNFIWAFNLESSTYWSGLKTISIDKSGNILLGGNFKGDCDFDPGTGFYMLNSGGAETAFILKLDSSANFIWARNLPSSFINICHELAVDDSCNVYSTGYFKDTVDFDPGVGVYELAAVDMDVFVWKLDSAGNFLWAKSFGGTTSDYANAIAVDSEGSVYTSGRYYGNVDFDPGPAVFNLTAIPSSAEAFLSKLDASGNFVWAQTLIGINVYSLCIDTSKNIYAAGYFFGVGTLDFDLGPAEHNLTSNGSQDIFISKISATGDFLTAINLGGSSNDYCYSMRLDKDGNLVCTGVFWDTVDFDFGLGTSELVSNGVRDIYIQKLGPCLLSKSTEVVSACGTYTWMDGITYTADNDSATFMFVDSLGCDNLVSLELTILTTLDTSVTIAALTLSSNQAGATYSWIDCSTDLVIPGETNQDYTATANGSYAVIVTFGACVDTSGCITINTVAIFDNLVSPLFKVYPNPAGEVFTVVVENQHESDIGLYDAVGNLVLLLHLTDSVNVFSAESIPAGIYFLKSENSDFSTAQIFILRK